ncbi:DinB family protein [Trebonia kvetii]|uniref:DinB family protein n=1 Tax=Trebonia kvetii TaxID=2480626 RepID=A0A6P2BUY2_9ACTN|nr:DinB family protein [Trebonia kvetii]TVZ01023.1 DinB family protein [Trebonia kvetii]
MATTADLLADGFGRIRENVAEVLDGLTPSQLSSQLDAEANSVSWLIWHLTRVQDDHVAAAFGVTQVWSADGWARRFGLPAATMDHGYGQTPEQVAEFAKATASAELLGEYHEAVHAQTIKLLSQVSDADLDRIVDKRWTPPVTLGVRLVSVMDDDMQHVGQAAFVQGILLRRG